MSQFGRWCFVFVFPSLLACNGKSPSEPLPVTPVQPVTANVITITKVVPEPGHDVQVGARVFISFHYETLIKADVGCWLTKGGVQVGGHTGRVVDAGTRGNEQSDAEVDLNQYQYGVTRTDGITCTIEEDHFPLPPTIVQSTSMPAVYNWFVR